MNVLLIAPTVDTSYECVSPIGLMNLYLIGKSVGCNMHFLDLSNVSYLNGLSKILSQEYDLIGISCNFTNAVPYCIKYIKDIKHKYPDTIVVSGGNHATMVPEDLLFNGCDYVIRGEGESSFKEFLERIVENKYIRDLKNLAFLQNGQVVKNPLRQPLDNLDNLPFNDYSEFDLKPYFKHTGINYLNIETSRGCIYNCSFCATVKMWGREFRYKSPQRIVEEFKVAKAFNCDYVFLCDDDTALDEENLQNFCRLLIKENVIIPWGTTIGSNSVKLAHTFDIMARSGCIKVNICVESANDRILKAYRKPFTLEDNRRTLRSLLKKRILVHNHGIIGFPGERFHETFKTYFYLMKTSPIWHVTILEPRPGTDYWYNWDKKGDISQYRLFGKANVLISNNEIFNYTIYRFFALFYFLNPRRFWNAFFNKRKAIRYNYWIQYYVAYRTLRENIFGFFYKLREKNNY